MIDEIRVLRPIRFQSIRRNEVGAKAPVGKIRSAMRSGVIGSLVLVADETASSAPPPCCMMSAMSFRRISS